MLNRRHIRTKVIQSIYSNSVELLDHSTLKTYITKSSSTTLDLLYCMIDFIKEFLDFLRERKKYWLFPIIIVLALFGFLIVLSQGSAIAPFIYTLF